METELFHYVQTCAALLWHWSHSTNENSLLSLNIIELIIDERKLTLSVTSWLYLSDITSESLSQVNPQSSVEIKCILEGSSSVLNSLEIRLSRSEEGLDEVGIYQVNDQEISSNRREPTYRVMNVSQDDQFFCILFRGLDAIGAVSVTEFVYRLPSISDPPTELTRTTTSVTITWRPWDEETDVGDPPVVAYIPYYKMDPSQDWMNGSRIQADQTLEYTASSLETDRNYTSFSVAAVGKGRVERDPEVQQ
ncbi:hypothetical protein BSL78_02445 [Apostichopus japonicus]|uniref:Fibronectin type-III domain-containing protein n=1 Tax=Stichopus japonicus TaxID=307972 RepID=A0A2G8LK24_STIJA|nr:hypothetical protein BSL78_02445 [Apostichopus japonicus]